MIDEETLLKEANQRDPNRPTEERMRKSHFIKAPVDPHDVPEGKEQVEVWQTRYTTVWALMAEEGMITYEQEHALQDFDKMLKVARRHMEARTSRMSDEGLGRDLGIPEEDIPTLLDEYNALQRRLGRINRRHLINLEYAASEIFSKGDLVVARRTLEATSYGIIEAADAMIRELKLYRDAKKA